MSICESGINDKVSGGALTVWVSSRHPLILLANAIPWQMFAEQVLPDLKQTTSKLKWWLGRKLKLRIHLAVYLLQQLLNKTDRQMEEAIKANAAYQFFCGQGIVVRWPCPDHTKMEAFRSRLSPETQRHLANQIAVLAVHFDPKHLDMVSTVQEANIAYPGDANLLVKIAQRKKRAVGDLASPAN